MAKKDNACDIAIVWSSLMYTLGEPYALYENVNHFIFGWKHFNFRLSIIYLDLNESTFSVRFPLLPVIVAMHLFSLPPPLPPSAVLHLRLFSSHPFCVAFHFLYGAQDFHIWLNRYLGRNWKTSFNLVSMRSSLHCVHFVDHIELCVSSTHG